MAGAPQAEQPAWWPARWQGRARALKREDYAPYLAALKLLLS